MEPLLEYIESVALLNRARMGVRVLITLASGVQEEVAFNGILYRFFVPADQEDFWLSEEAAIAHLQSRGLRSWQG